jgi:outer membrane protein
MKKVLKLTLAVVMVMCSTSLFAQKFGRINSQEIFASMPETKTAETELQAYAQELSAQIETLQVEFNTKYQEYQKNEATWNESIKQLKNKELVDIDNRIREFQQVAQQDMMKKQEELLAPIRDKATNAINEVAKAGGYIFVYDVTTGTMAYIDEAVVTDLGPAVRAKLGITEPIASTAPAK